MSSLTPRTPPSYPAQPGSQGTVFGIPLGELGWFASLLIGTALGFAAFFGATFLSILSLLVYNTATHGNIDYSYAYRRIGLPIGLLVLFVAYILLGTLWARRQLRRA